MSRIQTWERIVVNKELDEAKRRDVRRVIENYKKTFFRYARNDGLGEVQPTVDPTTTGGS